MKESYLKLNDGKTEFIIFGSKQQLAKFKPRNLRIGSRSISPVNKVRDLGVTFDSNMTMESQVSTSVRLAYHSLRNLRTIRNYLTPKAAEQLVHAFVTSRTDYCNALLDLPIAKYKGFNAFKMLLLAWLHTHTDTLISHRSSDIFIGYLLNNVLLIRFFSSHTGPWNFLHHSTFPLSSSSTIHIAQVFVPQMLFLL